MDTYLASVLISFLAALWLTPAIRHLAIKKGMVDSAEASQRKVHASDVPRLGGVAIVAAFYLPFVGLLVYETGVGERFLADPVLTFGLMGGGLVIAGLGLVDDLWGTSPKLKFLVQTLVAIGVVWLGCRIEVIDLPFIPQLALGWLAFPISVLWIVAIINAVNLIDGLDGLAAGLALFGLVPFLAMALYHQNVILALISCSLAGATLGFLVYNFHPARIFMGDTGSMFLGFVLAVTAVETGQKSRGAVAILIPVLALGLPIMDTLIALIRRAALGQPLFAGDRQHIHHRLLSTGMSHKKVVLLMYGFAAAFAALALVVSVHRDLRHDDLTAGLVLLVTTIVAALLLRQIGYLTLPDVLDTERRMASMTRTHNRAFRDHLPTLREFFSATASMEQISASAVTLARQSGARWAQLTLSPTLGNHPIRTWAFDEGIDPLAGPEDPRQFPLTSPNGDHLGVLTLAFDLRGALAEGTLQSVEAACRDLASALATQQTKSTSLPTTTDEP